MKIQTKLRISLISASFIIAVSIISASYFSMVKHFEEQEGNLLKENATLTAKAIDRFMQTRVADFNVLSNNPLFSTSSNKIVSEYLKRVIKEYPYYENLFYVNKKGIIISSSDQKLIGLNILELEPSIKNEFDKTIRGGHEDVYISDISKVSQKEIEKNSPLEIKLLSDVINLEQDVVGALVGFVNIKTFKKLILDNEKGTLNNQYYYLLDDKGNILKSNNTEVLILEQHPDLLKSGLLKKVENGKNGFYIYTDYKGEKVISGYSKLSKYGTEKVGNWSLLSIAPHNEAMKPVYQMIYKSIFTFLLTILFLVMLLFSFFNKKIKSALKSIENKDYSLRETSIIAKIGYWEYYTETDTTIWSEYLYEIFGTNPKGKAIPLNETLKMLDTESQEKVKQATYNLNTLGTPYDIEIKIINNKSNEIWIRSVAQPIYNKQNKIIGRKGVTQNITERKLTQEALDNQNKKLHELNNALNQAQKLSHIGSWHWNLTTDSAEWSDEMYNIYGVNKDTFYPSNKNVTKMVLPKDLHKIERGLTSIKFNNVFIPFKFKIRRPSGEIRTLYIMAIEKKSEHGIFGVTKDITAQTEIESKNKRITEEYKDLFENATIAICNEDFTEVFKILNDLKKLNITDIKSYLEENPNVFISILSSVKINSVNKATLKLFKAKNSQDYINNLHNTLGEGSEKVIENLIKSIWNGEKTFTSEINYKTLKGNEFTAIISVPIPQTKRKQKMVPVSIQSIQKVKDAKLTIKESLHKLNESQKIAKIGSWLLNPFNNRIEWSEETFNIWEIDTDKTTLNYDVIFNKIHIDDQELYQNALDKSILTGKPYDIEHRICLKDNKQKWVRDICKPILGENGQVISLAGTTQDITEKKEVRNKIEKAEQMYRLLTDNSNDLICLHETNSTFRYISPSIETLLGYKQHELIGSYAFNLIHNDDLLFFKNSIEERILKKVPNNTFYSRVIHKNGTIIWLEFSTSAVSIENKFRYILTSARDVTQWMKAKKEIEVYQKSLQKLTTEISLIEEKQKKEIALNIHDHLSQSLVISKMKINNLKKNPTLKIINDDLKFIEDHISEALENSRKITYELSPPILYQLGIIDALQWYTEDLQNTHKIECRFSSNVTYIKLDDVKAILIYRCIQEAITNTLKYAKATLINLDIDTTKNWIDIRIRDNGIGFDTSILDYNNKHSSLGFGLFTIQERIKNIKGKFTITSKIEEGTKVKIIVPIK